jgi:hypothetical protein
VFTDACRSWGDSICVLAGIKLHLVYSTLRQDRVVAERRHDQRVMPGVETAQGRYVHMIVMIVAEQDRGSMGGPRKAIPGAESDAGRRKQPGSAFETKQYRSNHSGRRTV